MDNDTVIGICFWEDEDPFLSINQITIICQGFNMVCYNDINTSDHNKLWDQAFALGHNEERTQMGPFINIGQVPNIFTSDTKKLILPGIGKVIQDFINLKNLRINEGDWFNILLHLENLDHKISPRISGKIIPELQNLSLEIEYRNE